MAHSVNKIILVGTVGRDPELHTMSPGGQREAELSLATVDPDTDRTHWHRVVFRDRLADFAEKYIERGGRIYVEGRMHYNCHDRGDGVQVPTADVVAREVVLLRPDGEVTRPDLVGAT